MAFRAGRKRLIQEMRKRILSGLLVPGTKLEATSDIASEFGVAPPTAHAALQDLERDGLIVRERGRGTFVAERRDALNATVLLAIDFNGGFRDRVSDLVAQLEGAGMMTRISDLSGQGPSGSLDIDRESPIAVVTNSIDCARQLSSERHTSPVVCLGDIYTGSFNGHSVTLDRHQAASQAVKHLVALGHRRIACYTPFLADRQPAIGKHMVVRDAEVSGYLNVLKDEGIEYDGFYGITPGERGHDLLSEMIARHDRPTAVYCSQDHRAIEFIEVAQGAGLSVPEDIAVVSHGNTHWAELFSLTSVEPRYNQALMATVALLARIRDRDPLVESWIQCRIEPRLVVRKSCGAPACDGARDQEQRKKEIHKLIQLEKNGGC